jgi:SAM-dependent methyltransferase
MPFRDQEFDAVLSNGGFNHFNAPEAALREIGRRVLSDSHYEVIWRGGGGGYLMVGAAPEKSTGALPEAFMSPPLVETECAVV